MPPSRPVVEPPDESAKSVLIAVDLEWLMLPSVGSWLQPVPANRPEADTPLSAESLEPLGHPVVERLADAADIEPAALGRRWSMLPSVGSWLQRAPAKQQAVVQVAAQVPEAPSQLLVVERFVPIAEPEPAALDGRWSMLPSVGSWLQRAPAKQQYVEVQVAATPSEAPSQLVVERPAAASEAELAASDRIWWLRPSVGSWLQSAPALRQNTRRDLEKLQERLRSSGIEARNAREAGAELAERAAVAEKQLEVDRKRMEAARKMADDMDAVKKELSQRLQGLQGAESFSLQEQAQWVQAYSALQQDDFAERANLLQSLQTSSAQASLKGSIWRDEHGTRSILVQAASLTSSMDRKSRACALGTLWNLAMDPANRHQMWSDTPTRAAIVEGAGATDEQDGQTRTSALAAFHHLSEELLNRDSMWAHSGARAALVAAARASDWPLRERAVGVFWNLSATTAIRAEMWADKLGARAIIVESALLDVESAQKVRLRALAALYNMSTVIANRSPMWRDAAGARAALVAAASHHAPEAREARAYGLAALQNLSSEEAESMWQDEGGARLAVLQAALLTDDADVKARACATLVMHSFARVPANRSAMWQDSGARAAALMAASASGSIELEVRESGLLVLCHLASEAAIAEKIWKDIEARSAIVKGAQLIEPHNLRNRLIALRAVQELASVAALRADIWCDEGARAAVLAAAAATNSSRLRESAYRILLACSSDKDNKELMWADEATRAMMCSGVQCDGAAYRRVRICAAGSLQNLTSAPRLKNLVWADVEVRSALLGAARLQDPGDRAARTCALGALQNLSAHMGADSSSMWEDTESREALLAAARLSDAADRKARVCALGTLRNLAATTKNKERMWSDKDGARSIVVDAAKLSDKSDREVRDCAIATLWNLSKAPFNGLSADDLASARLALEAASRLTAPEDRQARAYAEAAVRSFATIGRG